jgi:hypothetical protein
MMPTSNNGHRRATSDGVSPVLARILADMVEKALRRPSGEGPVGVQSPPKHRRYGGPR